MPDKVNQKDDGKGKGKTTRREDRGEGSSHQDDQQTLQVCLPLWSTGRLFPGRAGQPGSGKRSVGMFLTFTHSVLL
jgi:hypothetical protein